MEEREKFAYLCTLFVPESERARRYKEALAEFDEFCGIAEEYAFDIDAIHVGMHIYGKDQEGRRRDIGEFHLMISREKVVWENLSRTVPSIGGGWHAPYVSDAKTVCGLPDEHEDLQMAIADGKLAKAFGVMKKIAGTGPGYHNEIARFPLAAE